VGAYGFVEPGKSVGTHPITSPGQAMTLDTGQLHDHSRPPSNSLTTPQLHLDFCNYLTFGLDM